jgi:glutamyl-tRNA synthetase
VVRVQAIKAGKVKKWIKDLGKAKGLKGKRLFMPIRIALTGQMAGPDVGQLLTVLDKADEGLTMPSFVPLDERMRLLREELAKIQG